MTHKSRSKAARKTTPDTSTPLANMDVRTGMTAITLKQAVTDHLQYSVGRLPMVATPHDYYRALALAVRDRMQSRWVNTAQTYLDLNRKIACYLSAEFLMGPHLGNNLINLGLEQAARTAMTELGYDLDTIMSCEEEPGLGNGGLGRLAACYLDSLATLERPAIGYGIRYEFGIFDQEIHDGWQTEVTDKWLRHGNSWEIAKPDIAYNVNWGGHSEHYRDEDGCYRMRWMPYRVVKGAAYDTPIQGYGVNTCNTLRLWSAEAVESFDFQAFNTGDYYQAVTDKMSSETVTKILYPNDEPEIGKRLRLAQQYFFVSCSLQDMLHLMDVTGESVHNFACRFAVQLNDTHPSISVAELMRLLMDERRLSWDDAWSITTATFAYTNHTLLPEALETWSLPMFREYLPRHLDIIYEINNRFLAEVRERFPGDEARLARMSLIGEEDGKCVRMAHLATVGSHAVNGVAALHSELLKASVMKDFYEFWPERFSNKTNGVTPRRFLALANPGLCALLTGKLGDGWVAHLDELKKIEAFADQAAFRRDWRAVKQSNKERLAAYIRVRTGIELNPTWLFDIQVKRIHEYKRQLLNALRIVVLYNRLRENPNLKMAPRTFFFAGKAAPAYHLAKVIIKFINNLAGTIDGDPIVRGRLKVVFLPEYCVSLAERLIPATDVSNQISTAGYEASGTSNMKFMMNGALTLGTRDGATIEMAEEAGEENFFLFGLTADRVAGNRDWYSPRWHYENEPETRAALDLIESDYFSRNEAGIFAPLRHTLLTGGDHYMHLADLTSYLDADRRLCDLYADSDGWAHKAIVNVACSGKFSSDRTIAEYAADIWNVKPCPVL